uniref:Zinc transporter ZIP10 n=1 Tax=Macrostomum lignano TaxID=282301 RepID=A0A1I8GLX9_9PLAT
MSNSGEAARISALAADFIRLYGRSGIAYGRNVTDFLAGISMSPGLLSKAAAAGAQLECPSQPSSLMPLAWTPHNASHLVATLLAGIQTPACYDGRLPTSGLRGAPLPGFELGNGFGGGHGGGHGDGHSHGAPSPAQVWGFGLLFVTLINLCALVGISFLPCIGRRLFNLLMAFMTALAVSSLTATALLVLLPECLQLEFIHEEVNKENSSLIRDHHDHDHHDHHDHHAFHGSAHTSWEDFLSEHPWYLWRCCTGGGSFGHGHSHALPEPQLQQEDSSTALASYKSARVSPAPPVDAESPRQKEAPPSGEPAAYGAATVLPVEVAEDGAACCSDGAAAGSGSGGNAGSVSTRLVKVQPVAWMILLGDALHNFVDGLSIGVAFSRSTLSGVSISLAVLCEELPHELGDFAILLSAGMSMPMALLCNFLSACTCYLGFALGVALGETDASVWIFAIASGMFLYIGLVDMLPAVSSSLEQPEALQSGRAKLFALQNLGLLVGFVAILMLAVYGGNISLGE